MKVFLKMDSLLVQSQKYCPYYYQIIFLAYAVGIMSHFMESPKDLCCWKHREWCGCTLYYGLEHA